MKLIMLLTCLGLTSSLAWADSPLTEGEIDTGYIEACAQQKLPEGTCAALAAALKQEPDYKFLADESVALDQRLAVVNALGWSSGQGQAQAFADYRKANGIPETPATQLIQGYKLALETTYDIVYHEDKAALTIVKAAAAQLPAVFSAQLILSLVYTQSIMGNMGNWGEVWENYNGVLQAFDPAHRDLLPKSVDVVTSYMSEYKR